MRLFKLKRLKDISGVSGTGYVAEGVVFTNGKTILTWLGEVSSVTVFSSIEEVERIHGHAGSTVVEWIDVVKLEFKDTGKTITNTFEVDTKTYPRMLNIPGVTILNAEDLV